MSDLVLPELAPIIPDFRSRTPAGKPADSWLLAIEDWNRPNPAIRLHVALKDWRPEWISGPYGRKHGRAGKYNQRRVVALEYQRWAPIL